MKDRKDKPTHERLYELNQEKQKKHAQKVLEQSKQFDKPVPEGGVNSAAKREKLDQTLYEDAKRRKEEQEKKKQELDKTRDLPKEKMYKNSTSDKYV